MSTKKGQRSVARIQNSEPCQTSKMEYFMKIVNGFWPLFSQSTQSLIIKTMIANNNEYNKISKI